MTADDAPETLLKAIREHAFRYVDEADRAGASSATSSPPCSPSKPDLRPIEVVSAKPDWVELLVPCDREAATRIQEFLSQLDSDLPEDVRARRRPGLPRAADERDRVGRRGSTRARPCASPTCARGACCSTGSPTPARASASGDLTHAAVNNPPDATRSSTRSVREEKGLRPGGFGLLMTRQIVDELLYNEAHNEVVFVKYLD